MAVLLTAAFAEPASARESLPDLAAYVKARAADADGAVDAAVRGYDEALAAKPDSILVAIRAYREALSAGRYDLARRALSTLEAAGVAPNDGAVLRLADAVRERNYAAAEQAIGRIAQGPLEFIVPSLRAWIAFDRGERHPESALERSDQNALGARYAEEQRALLTIARGDGGRGVKMLQPLLAADSSNLDLRLTASAMLAEDGKEDAARTLLPGDGTVMRRLRERLPEKQPGASIAIAGILNELAARLDSDRLLPLNITLARAALLLDPESDRTRLVLADALSRSDASEIAQQMLGEVDADSAFAPAASQARVAVLQRAGKDARALEVAAELARSDGADLGTVRHYADLLMSAEHYTQAAEAYDRAIALAGDGASWALYLQKGGALEQAGRWDAALPLLRKAAAMAPDEPIVLNYLGYAQVERGENLAAAVDMLERASDLRPDDPSITDSLGWAYYQRGETRKALPLLQRAAEASPADATINEHLGDTLWRSGRHYEARYAWQAARVFADGADAERLAEKLALGLKRERN
ncbi:tetratricopeptide repeat protein [Stakelama saccharophila]|uniref:Tetratricopeptide repeat protein n=1 Tax=Stakelama saccharophila TaxID=3075605 RepID=A0ABZ0B5M2_9SPHN|nr:tetratricopeptide repeat protein [Stakelama sp. W311]WNO52471.1 tetratricopeptide repeat protein [Stakelama sp. W311]